MGLFTKLRNRAKRSSSQVPPTSTTSSTLPPKSDRVPCVPLASLSIPAPARRVTPDSLQCDERAHVEARQDTTSVTLGTQHTSEGRIQGQQVSTIDTTIVQPHDDCQDETRRDSLLNSAVPVDAQGSETLTPNEANLEVTTVIKPITRTDTLMTLLAEQEGDRWTTAFAEAMSELDEDARSVVMSSKVQDIHELFTRLNDIEATHKEKSLIRKGMDRLRVPLAYLDAALSAASPFVALEPAASSAFGIARGVTTLAIGICGVEARLSGNIKQMLEQIAVIDDCDAVTQSFESQAIHNALVTVYKDLLAFFCSATKLLNRQVTVLALLSEQLNQRLPPLVDNYVSDSKLLSQHIKNATDALMKKIETMLIEEKVARLLGSQRLIKTRERHVELRSSIAEKACEWTLTNVSFTTWLGGCGDAAFLIDQRILAVFGDMGCGKTITMAYLFEHVGSLYSSRMPRAMRAFYYITSDETGRPLEVYLSIIQQLMDQRKYLKVMFDRWDDEQGNKGKTNQTQDPSLLSEFLVKAVKAIERPLFIFIDGLDECRNSIDGGAGHIISVLRQCTEASPMVRICVSGRNQQHIRKLLCNNSSMFVPRAAERDKSIVTHLVQRGLTELDSEAQDIVIQGLSKMAEGSAIWVRLAVDLLAKRGITKPRRLKEFINEIPGTTVLGLYAKLYTQVAMNDPENCFLLSTALEFLAVAERPLSIAELSWFVALVEKETKSARDLSVDELTDYGDSPRLLKLLNPFIVSVGVNDRDEGARQVRLNHHSVREHILQSSPQRWAELAANPGLAQDQSHINHRQADLHSRVARQCVQYLLMDDLKDLDLFTQANKNTQVFDEMGGAGLTVNPFTDGLFMDDSTEDLSAESAPAVELDSDGTQRSDPEVSTKTRTKEEFYNPADRGFGEFFAYASCYWLEHMHKADIDTEAHRLQPASLDSGYRMLPPPTARTMARLPVSLLEIKRLADEGNRESPTWWEQFYRPDCTVIRDESRQRPRFHDFLTLIALFGSESQLREAVRHQVIPASGREDAVRRISPFRNAIREVLRMGDPERLSLLLPYEQDRDFKEIADLFMLVLENWERDNRLADQPNNNGDGKYGSAFDHILRASGIMVDQKWGNEFFCRAASHGCLPMIQRLLHEADRSTALREEITRCADRVVWDCAHQSIGMAAWNGHTAVVEYLLDRGGECEGHLRYRDTQGNTVLHQAMRCGNPRLMRVLCEHLPDAINERRVNGDTPLQVLVFEQRSVELVGVLLELGADVRSGYNERGVCPQCQYDELVVGPNGDVSDWHEPLRMAARYGNLELCRVLIKGSGRYDLLWVVAVESKDIAKQLTDEFGLE